MKARALRQGRTAKKPAVHAEAECLPGDATREHETSDEEVHEVDGTEADIAEHDCSDGEVLAFHSFGTEQTEVARTQENAPTSAGSAPILSDEDYEKQLRPVWGKHEWSDALEAICEQPATEPLAYAVRAYKPADLDKILAAMERLSDLSEALQRYSRDAA